MADSEPDPFANTVFSVVTFFAAAAYGGLVLKLGWDVWGAKKTPTTNEVQSGIVAGIGLVFGPALVAWLGISVNQLDGPNHLTGAGNWLRRAIWAIGRILGSIRVTSRIAMGVYLLAGAFAGATYVFNNAQTPKVILGLAAAFGAQVVGILTAGLKKGLGG